MVLVITATVHGTHE